MMQMDGSIAIVGAGVSGLTCGVVFAERRQRVAILADEVGSATTSAAAGAIWFPYDVEPLDKVLAWSRRTFEQLHHLTSDLESGVAMIELRCFSRHGEIEMPNWAAPLGAGRLKTTPRGFSSGFALDVPLIDTSIYLDYLAERFTRAGGTMTSGKHFAHLEEVPREYDLIINCAGVGARELVRDNDVEAHRGQVVLVAKSDLDHAIVCDDPPLMYVFPRSRDCVFGGTNEISDNREPSPAETASIIEECSRVLGTSAPEIRGTRVGLRPYRKSGVRLEKGSLGDGRTVIHNYGHGGSGFTLAWGCAEEVAQLASD